MFFEVKGLLPIPDLSGFTEFVGDVEISHGDHIIAALLELPIRTDRLGLTICEIEGDAIFFCRVGSPSVGAATARSPPGSRPGRGKAWRTSKVWSAGGTGQADSR